MSPGWLESLDPATRSRAEKLIKLMGELGAPEPEEWVYSEITEDIPQLARFLVLRHLWRDLIDSLREDTSWIQAMVEDAENDPAGPFADAGMALKRLMAAGADLKDIGTVARFVAYEAVFGTLTTIDEGYDPELDEDGPGWALVELDAEGNPTGRSVGGLHESLLSLDPSGREGRPP
jgi:hypothetical protein